MSPIKIVSLLCLTAFLSAEEIRPMGIKEVVIQDQLHLDKDASIQREMNVQFLQKPFTVETVEAIQKLIIARYQEMSGMHVLVTIPDQEISTGKVQFIVEERKIGNVTYKGKTWDLSLKNGDPLNLDDLKNEIEWLNRNPFHSSSVILSPGHRPKTTDIEVVTKSRFPWRFFVGADDTGTQTTGQERVYAGFNWGNAFGFNDLLTFQYTASPDFHQFNSYLLNYTSFLPWKHVLYLFGGYSTINPDITGFRNEGKNAQASFRYEIPLKPFYTTFKQEVTWGFDYKNMNNNLFFESEFVPFMVQSVVVTQLYFSYGLKDQIKNHALTFKAELLGSPFHHPHYKDLRAGSQSTYLYGRLSLGDIYQFHPKFKFNWLLRAEAATGPLLPSEQFGLGGYDTVRGYEERIFNVDNGICANVELQSTPFSFYKKDALTFLAFVDYAWGHNYDATLGLPSHQFLLGVGPGLRYRIDTYLNLRIDYGFQLKAVEGDDHLGRLHFGLTLSY